MATPNSSSTRIHHPKNAKATTEIKADPELWRDIQANVRKMDDLYDATFYMWLRSEDNVLVTASYLQRLAGEYDLERIEHALCWLVNGWRLESIAILVKQVTFDWVVTKGDQGELNRARLVLALTDNWAIQYIARLACTLLTSAQAASPPAPLLRSPSGHARMSSLPGSPITAVATTFGTDGHSYGSPLAISSRSSTPPLSARPTTSSSPSSPSTSMANSPIFSTFTPQPTHGRRMAVSRRLGSPMPTAMPSTTTEDTALHLGRPMSAAGPVSPAVSMTGSQRSGHYRQSSSTLPVQPHRQQDHTQHGTSVSPLNTSSSALPAPATPLYPSQQQTSYHPHCNVPHHHPSHQHHQHHPSHRSIHGSRNHGSHSHVRQQSQPGNVSASKQHWLQQQSSYSSGPVFCMNKSVFMEELSRKWSFCRLSEFFQCMDPASGITHPFKCKLLKESALREEQNQKLPLTVSKVGSATTKQPPRQQVQEQGQRQEHNQQPPTRSTEETALTSGDMPLSPMDHTVPEVIVNEILDDSGDVVMADSETDEAQQSSEAPSSTSAVLSATQLPPHSSSSPFQATNIAQGTRVCDSISLHPFDHSADSTTDHGAKSSPASVPSSMSQQSSDQASFRSLQSYSHADYNDDMHSGLGRGSKSADRGHQHHRAQTVEATMSRSLCADSSNGSHHVLASASSSSASSPTSTSAASASMSTLTLTESGMESAASRPMSQPHSSYTSTFTSSGLYRHTTTLPTLAVSSTATLSSSSSTSVTTSTPTNGGQRLNHDSTSAKRKNSLGVSLTPPSHCPSFSSTSSSSGSAHSSSTDQSVSSSSGIYPGARRTSTSTSTSNEDLKRLRCSRQNSTSSTSGI